MIGDGKFKDFSKSFSETTSYDIPSSFSSINEAKAIVEHGYCLYISSQAAQLSRDPAPFPAAFQARMGHFATLKSRFLLALQAYVESKSSYFTPKENIAIAVLQLQVLSSYVSLNVEHLPPNDRSRWNEFIPEFKEMVALGEKIVSSTSPGNDHEGQTTSFCYDMGIIIPLFNVASLCRDPVIRRKAITLLRSTSRQEGLWNSLLIAKAAERIMEIQEGHLGELKTCTVGPDQAMLSGVQPIFELDGRGGRLQYIRQGQGDNAQINVVEEVFSW